MHSSYKRLLPERHVEFPRSALEGSVIDRFRQIAAEHCHRTAVKHADASITYAMLDDASRALAALLIRETGLRRQPVAMLYRHGIDYIVAQLAVLRSGNFYASIDCDLASERQQLLLENLGSCLLLCDDAGETTARELAAMSPRLRVFNTKRAALNTAAACPVAGMADSPDVHIGPHDYACVVFTSGSTGPPQGVIISHRNILHFTRGHTNYMHLHCEDRATQICPLSTAASNAEIFPVLLNGATLFPFSIKESGLGSLGRLLLEESISMFTAVPTLFRMLMHAYPQSSFPAMRMLRLAGDRTTRVDVELFRTHFTSNCLLRVGLGASEILMFAHHFIDAGYEMQGEVVPVGYPLEDIELLLLDDDRQQITQPGDCGEIAVRSRYLSVGYWRNPQLSGERFLTDASDPEMRIYLSRDIGYRDRNGLLHHVGRSDARVKIYGRMFLVSDIEEALLAIPNVREAAVVPFDSGERGTELIAYVVTEAGFSDIEIIRQQLAAKIVAEARPRTIKILDSLPLQANNKINRLRLKDMAKNL